MFSSKSISIFITHLYVFKCVKGDVTFHEWLLVEVSASYPHLGTKQVRCADQTRPEQAPVSQTAPNATVHVARIRDMFSDCIPNSTSSTTTNEGTKQSASFVPIR